MHGSPARALPLAALILATVAAAGCVVPDLGIDGQPTAPTPRTLYLTGDGGLTAAVPTATEPHAVPAGNFFTRWGAASGYARFDGESFAESVLVTGNATVTAFARADGPALQAGVFPHFLAYVGAGDAFMADGSVDVEPVLLPGDVVAFDVVLNLPPGGFVLREGDAPSVLLIAVMTQDDAADVSFLVDSEQYPARVVFDAAPVTLPAPAPNHGEGGIQVDGALVGSAYATTDAGAQASIPFDVPPGTARLDVTLEVGDARGFGDLDVAVWKEGGDLVARGVTPFGVEALRLFPGHYEWAGEEVVVTVTNYGSAEAQYRLLVTPVPALEPAWS